MTGALDGIKIVDLTAMITGVDNVYSSGAAEANHLGHATMHLLTFPVVAAILWVPAALILFVLRLVSKRS